MKKLLSLLLFLSFFVSFSQQEASNWYFGENAGIRFDTTAGTVTALNDGQLNTREGCASISDRNGDLLFYTDGSLVYNRLHNVMPNGTGLLGDNSSTQSAVVIPKPNDPDIFYIFTVGSNQNPTGLKYSEVDMTLDGGMGDITIKNRNLLNQCSEKIAAVLKDCQSEAIWVVAFANVNGSASTGFNTFHAFEVTSTGINTNAVTSNFNMAIGDARGYLKISPDGTKLACANVDNGLYLFDFDTATGMVSNDQRININGQNNQPYGLEFSPDSQVLYANCSNDNFQNNPDDPSTHSSRLVQFDLTAADIQGSQYRVDDRNLYRGGLQLGPDGKIYRALSATYNSGISTLGVINAPNELGAACDYEHNAVNLGSNNSTQGLPPFIASFFNQKIDIIRQAGSESSTHLPLCTGDTYTLVADDVPGATYTWTQDGNPLAESDFDLVVSQAGTYEVLIELNTGDCETLEGEAIVSYHEYPVANQPNTFFICDDDNDGAFAFNLSTRDGQVLGTQDPTVYSVHYFENPTDAMNNENEIMGAFTNTLNPQPIYVRIHNDGNPNCYDTTSFNIQVFNSPVANSVDPFVECDDDSDGDSSNGQTTINLADFDDDVLGTQSDTDYTVSYHDSPGDAQTGDSALPMMYYNMTPINETIYVRIENNVNTECYDTTSFDITINPIPAANDVSIIQCDEDGTLDGLTQFNLYQVEDDITGGASGVTVRFYDDRNEAENNGTEIDGNNYSNTSNPQVVFVTVTNDTSLCSEIAEITLQVSTTQINDYQAPAQCDELDSEDGVNTFDLDAFTLDIQTINSIALPITYYETYEDALLEQNALATPYTNTNNPYNHTIYARAENANACYGISEVTLTVNPLPELLEDETTYYCLNTYPDTITLEAGVLNDDPNNYTYVWSSGQMTNEIQINQAGTYTVTVTNRFNCSKDRTIIVEPSNIATIDSVDIIDGNTYNSVTVNASGEGTYEYALYSSDGTPYLYYQESHIFDSVYPGIYTLMVRDVKNDCGIVEQVISVIGFPQYFTPNNDGYHDTWQILGVSEQFQPNTKIKIFNRYGKLLKEISPLSEGWDGTFNGRLLPNDDYWFSAKLQDGRDFFSHFTLKR